MCNLYRMTKNADEVAQWFDAANAARGVNLAAETYPGTPGLVVADGSVRPMNWGFPLVMTGKNGQKLKPRPVNNARTDKLGSYFWRDSYRDRRCLIPLTAWAEAEGDKGSKTRTWLSVPDAELFACAGLWSDSDEFGVSYAMVMTGSDGSPAGQVHDRMPVLLAPDDYERWLSAPPDEAKTLCNAWTGPLNIDRTDEAWVKGRASQKPLF